MAETFTYEVPAGPYGTGATIEAPRFSQLPFGVMRAVRSTELNEQIFEIFDQLADRKLVTPETIETIDRLTIVQVTEFMAAWQKDSGVELPES